MNPIENINIDEEVAKKVQSYQLDVNKKQAELERRIKKVLTYFEKDISDSLNSIVQSISILWGALGLNSSISDKIGISSDETYLKISPLSNALIGTHNIIITQMGSSTVAMSNSNLGNAALGYTGTFMINGQPISVSATDTARQIAESITNAAYASGLEVSATVINSTIQLRAKSYGASYTISGDGAGTWTPATHDPNSILSGLGILNGGSNALANSSAGTNTILTINGQSITSSSNILTSDTGINGCTLEILRASTPTVITATIDYNTEAIYSNLNELFDKVSDTVTLCDNLLQQKIKLPTQSKEEKEENLFISSDRTILSELQHKILGAFSHTYAGSYNWHFGSVTSSLTVTANTAINSTTLGITSANALHVDGTTLYSGDRFTIAGHTDSNGNLYIYTLKANSSFTTLQNTLSITPALRAAITAGTVVSLESISGDSFGIKTKGTNTQFQNVEEKLGIEKDKFTNSSKADYNRMLSYLVKTDSAQVGSALKDARYLGLIPRLYAIISQYLYIKSGRLSLLSSSSLRPRINERMDALQKEKHTKTEALKKSEAELAKRKIMEKGKISSNQMKIEQSQNKLFNTMQSLNPQN